MPQTPETEPRAVGGEAARLRQLERQRIQLERRRAQLDQQLATLRQQRARQLAQLAAARKENAALRQRVEALERSAGLDSSESGNLPPGPKRTRSLRGRSGTRSGS